jgi:hypothetical protein
MVKEGPRGAWRKRITLDKKFAKFLIENGLEPRLITGKPKTIKSAQFWANPTDEEKYLVNKFMKFKRK